LVPTRVGPCPAISLLIWQEWRASTYRIRPCRWEAGHGAVHFAVTGAVPLHRAGSTDAGACYLRGARASTFCAQTRTRQAGLGSVLLLCALSASGRGLQPLRPGPNLLRRRLRRDGAASQAAGGREALSTELPRPAAPCRTYGSVSRPAVLWGGERFGSRKDSDASEFTSCSPACWVAHGSGGSVGTQRNAGRTVSLVRPAEPGSPASGLLASSRRSIDSIETAEPHHDDIF
jgi:hypothetical protein